MNIFHWGPIFYVCSFASNRVPFMYRYYIRNSLWVAAILDIWSSQTGTFQQKNRSPEMINFFSYCIKKMSFSSSPKGIPHDRCRGTMTKNIFLQWKPIKSMNIFTGDLYSMYVVLKGIWVYMIYVIPFGEQQSWMSEVPKIERFKKKTGPRNDQFLFILH